MLVVSGCTIDVNNISKEYEEFKQNRYQICSKTISHSFYSEKDKSYVLGMMSDDGKTEVFAYFNDVNQIRNAKTYYVGKYKSSVFVDCNYKYHKVTSEGRLEGIVELALDKDEKTGESKNIVSVDRVRAAKDIIEEYIKNIGNDQYFDIKYREPLSVEIIADIDAGSLTDSGRKMLLGNGVLTNGNGILRRVGVYGYFDFGELDSRSINVIKNRDSITLVGKYAGTVIDDSGNIRINFEHCKVFEMVM